MTRLFRTILVPHDFSRTPPGPSRSRPSWQAHKGRLLVLHSLASSYPAMSLTTPAEAIGWLPLLVPSRELVADTRRRLTALVDGVVGRKRGLRVECRATVGDPFQGIMKAARGATVIAMSTLGRSGLAHLLIGSVAEKVVRHSPIPVLTIRPPGARRPARRSGTKAVKR